MSKLRTLGVALLALLGCWGSAAPARAAHWGVAIGIGVPGPYYYRPYGYYPYGYYRPYGVYVAPAPVVVAAPAPVYVQPAPIVVQQPAPAATVQPAPVATVQPPLQPVPTASATSPAPTPTVVAASTPAVSNREAVITGHLQKLTSPDDQVRCDAVEQLGRMNADRAVDSLTAVLAGDRSPMVREAAARSLGLIGAARALPALIRAAQADSDRDVRRSAQFTVEIIHNRLRQN
jgi:hypothetical protein